MLIFAFKTVNGRRKQEEPDLLPQSEIATGARNLGASHENNLIRKALAFRYLICMFLFFQDRLAVAESNENNL